jgi:acetolactate synthase-1/2/3 large subunit
MKKVGVADYGKTASDMMTLDRPRLDWTSLAKGMGVPSGRAESMEDFERLFRGWLANRGPFLIEVIV